MLVIQTTNKIKDPLWCLLSRLKTGQMTGAIVLEDSFNMETLKQAVKALLDESGLTACPLWNVTKAKHQALFRKAKKIQRVPKPTSILDQLLIDLSTGEKKMRVYKQMKMYNDESLNPVLYKKDDSAKG